MPETAGTPPGTIWAQRNNLVLLTVNVECKDPKFEFTDDSFKFSGVGLPENKLYEATLNFYGKIKPSEVSSKNTARCIEFLIPKAESGPYWPQLTAEKKKHHWLKVDFNKWVDEGSDASDEEKGMESIDDLIRKVDHLGGPGDSKPSFDDLDDDEKDSDDDEMPNLVA